MKSRNNVIFTALMSFAGVVSLSAKADATAITTGLQNVTSVTVDSNSSSRMRLRIVLGNGVSVSAYSGYACTPANVNKSVEVVESFRTLAQTAFLSGKRISVLFENATAGGCTDGIYSVTLQN